MKEYLLKRALPFTLTFIIGAAVGGFFQLFATRDGGHWRSWRGYGSYKGRRGCGKKYTGTYARPYAPESRRHIILFKPDARVPAQVERGWHGLKPARVVVTFGEDGKVRDVHSRGTWSREVSEAAERAARHIQFIPATLNGAPTTVTEEVEIRFSFE
jgi:Gram-negative bacterial TonB protein C-terminal